MEERSLDLIVLLGARPFGFLVGEGPFFLSIDESRFS